MINVDNTIFLIIKFDEMIRSYNSEFVRRVNKRGLTPLLFHFMYKSQPWLYIYSLTMIVGTIDTHFSSAPCKKI